MFFELFLKEKKCLELRQHLSNGLARRFPIYSVAIIKALAYLQHSELLSLIRYQTLLQIEHAAKVPVLLATKFFYQDILSTS